MYKISLPNFEGPFDLLLYFIKRDEINIYDIPIVKITEEFLKYIRLMQMFDLELAGEFLVMASTLMYIKAQMLLPKPKFDNDEEIEDPRTQLVQRLLEYKQFKEAAKELGEKKEDQKYTYYRQIFEQEQKLAKEHGYYTNTSVFDLLRAFKNVMDRKDLEPASHVVEVSTVTIDEMKSNIMKRLNNKGVAGFFELTENSNKKEIIAAFLAILELLKLQMIFIKQEEVFEDITIAMKPSLN